MTIAEDVFIAPARKGGEEQSIGRQIIRPVHVAGQA